MSGKKQWLTHNCEIISSKFKKWDWKLFSIFHIIEENWGTNWKKKKKKLNSESRRVIEFSWTNGKLKPMATQVGLSICYREKNDFDKFVKEP